MKYYAVKEGRIPGVYTTWAQCEAQVKGYPHADYKKFNNEEDARRFVFGDFKLEAPDTKEILQQSLKGILLGTQKKDVYEILKHLQITAEILDIEIDGINNKII